MKNIYHTAKGKIHPSPAAASPPAAGVGLSSSKHDALEVLKVLPAAILVLTAALTREDKEVLAYLVTRSLHGPSAATAPAERKRGTAHRPLLDCGCFDCYTSFWSRWDASPDRELIHQAIEAFEEHLASTEKRGAGRGARRRERRRMDRAEKVKERAEAAAEAVAEEEEKRIVEEPTTVTEAPSGEETGEDKSVGEEESVATGGEKRRQWADVKELFDSVFWSLWGPAV